MLEKFEFCDKMEVENQRSKKMRKFICFMLSIVVAFGTFSFVAIANTTNPLGDVNDNGVVEMGDLFLARKRMANIVTNLDINRDHLDVNADGKLTAIDVLGLRQHLAKKKLIVPTNFKFISTLKNSMNLYGRAQFADDGRSILLSQTAAGFEFAADCQGDLEINVVTSVQGKLNITVDDDFDNAFVVDIASNTTKYKVETNLEKGEHTFLIQKATEFSQNPRYEITGIAFEGSPAGKKPYESDKRIEFYGDSITSGSGNLVPNGSNEVAWKAQNGCQTYASFTAQALGADYAVASASGHGITGGWNNFVNKLSTYSEYTLVDEKTPWSRVDYDADLIVINMGTNDHHRDGNNLDVEGYTKACGDLVEKMRSENEDVEILWIIGMMNIPESAPIISALKSLDEKYDYVRFHRLEAKQNGGGAHPTVEDHKYHAQKLIEKINEYYPNMF